MPDCAPTPARLASAHVPLRRPPDSHPRPFRIAFAIFPNPPDPRRFIAALECLMYADYSLAIKAGVHFTLCGGTIAKLGTAYHHAKYLPGIDDLSLPGCFGMVGTGCGKALCWGEHFGQPPMLFSETKAGVETGVTLGRHSTLHSTARQHGSPH